MASFRLNIARCRGCEDIDTLTHRLADFGLPETEEFGVLNHSATASAAMATIVRKTHQSVQKLDPETQEIMAETVEKVTVYPFALRPDFEILETYAGPARGLEEVGVFLSSCMALPALVEPIELDIPSCIDRLAQETQRFQLRSIRVGDYAHNAYMAGPYTPKFMDTEHGKDFLQDYAESVKTADVRFQATSGRVNVKLSSTACFGYSCHEDDQSAVQTILRKLI
jgi:hypothetical protein